MEDESLFPPARRAGLIFQIVLALLLIAVSVWSLSRALNTQLGPLFLLYLFPALVSAALVPLLAYRFYALWRAYYLLGRDGLYLHWGLRAETIPIDQVRWVRRSGEALADYSDVEPGHRTPLPGAGENEQKPTAPTPSLPLPWLRWPGGVLGSRNLPARNFPGFTRVEYMADRTRDLILIAAGEAIFAISPADTQGFLDAYRRCSELGSTSPLPASSIHPTFLIARVWGTLVARYLIITGLVLNLALLAAVTIAIPARAQVILGFLETAEPVPAIRLMLLPFLSVVFFLADFFLGLFFFRFDYREHERRQGQVDEPEIERQAVLNQFLNGKVLAYLLWGSGVLTSLFFLVAVGFILMET